MGLGSRPVFAREEWTLLEPAQRFPLPLDDSVANPGTYRFRVLIWDHGADIRTDAVRFNAGTVLGPAAAVGGPIVDAVAEQLLLPPLEWTGVPWHGTESIDPVPLPGGRFELVTLREGAFVSTVPMPLQGFVLNEQGDLVLRRSLEMLGWESQEDSERVRHRALYRLSEKLEAGSYFLLVVAPEAESYFSVHGHRCDAARGAASRWIPFRVE